MRRNRGYDFGSTSENPEGLHRDDGGVRDYGAIDEDHIDCRQYTRPQRGSGFTNPAGDYGPSDMGSVDHIDGSLTRPQYPSGAGYTKQPDRGVNASEARARASSANEYWPDSWYGGPSKRQGG
jgi:hypothetical protein